MKEKLESLNNELNGVDLVLDKLEGKCNVSVFEKLCTNCDRVFKSFSELSIVEIVRSGNAWAALDFLHRLKNQVIRLKNYKEVLTAYLEMQEESLKVLDVQNITSGEVAIANEMNNVKNKTLVYEEGKAA